MAGVGFAEKAPKDFFSSILEHAGSLRIIWLRGSLIPEVNPANLREGRC